MTKLVRTALGQIVDFDLIKLKQQLAESPAPTEVKARENFVEKRLKRKLRVKTVPAAPVDSGEDLEEPKDPKEDLE